MCVCANIIMYGRVLICRIWDLGNVELKTGLCVISFTMRINKAARVDNELSRKIASICTLGNTIWPQMGTCNSSLFDFVTVFSMSKMQENHLSSTKPG